MARSSFFTNDAMIRRVHREHVVALAGPRALLMQAAHPVAFAGFFAHTGALDEPYERLQRTAQRRSGSIGFGDKAEAQTRDRGACARCTRASAASWRAGRPLPRRHAVRGRRPGAAAVDPRDARRLRRWSSTERYVRALTRDERDALLAGLPRLRAPVRAARRATCPTTIEDFDAYMRDMLDGDDLYVDRRGARARDRDRHAPAGAARARGRCWSSRTSSRSGCCRAQHAPRVRLLVGPGARARAARRHRVRQARASCRCCPTACATAPAAARAGGLTRPGPGRPVPPAPVADGLPLSAAVPPGDLRPAASERGSEGARPGGSARRRR